MREADTGKLPVFSTEHRSPGVRNLTTRGGIASLREVQRLAGNRAVASVLQRRVDLHYAYGRWAFPSHINASIAEVKEWFGYADKMLNRSGALVNQVDDPEVDKGLRTMIGLNTIKSYTFTGDRAGPELLLEQARAMAKAQDVPASFLTLLRNIWLQVRTMPENTWGGAIYDLYGGQVPGHPQPTVPSDRDDMIRIRQWLSPKLAGWTFWLQGEYFLHAESPGYQGNQPMQRFYFNPAPDYKAAIRTFLGLLVELVGPRSGKAKLGSPSQYGHRNDCIVMWVPKSLAHTVQNHLAQRGLAHFGALSTGPLPPMLSEFTAGVATGEEPTGSSEQSFGSLRSLLLAEALRETTTIEQFINNAAMAFSIAGIPWTSPQIGGRVVGLTHFLTTGRTV